VAGALQVRLGSDDHGDATVVEALYTLLLVCFFGARSELWEPFDSAIERLGTGVPPLLALLSDTFGDPARRAAQAAGRLDAAISGLDREVEPSRIVRTSIAAVYVNRVFGCREALWRVVNDGRQGGAVTSAIDALMMLGFDSMWAGDWEEAENLIGEGLELCEARGYRLLAWPGFCGRALIAAMRGDQQLVSALADRMNQWAIPRRAGSIQAYAHHARALAALGRGEFEEAFQHAAAVSPPGLLAPHVPHALWLVMDLVEAAVRTGRRPLASAHAAAARSAGLGEISSRLGLLTVGATAMAASGREAEDLFEEALAIPGADRWAFDLARVRLAYGELLRRAKAIGRAREQLTPAMDTFRWLGAVPWITRASNELRATGLSYGSDSAPVDSAGSWHLTPRELEMATLAATGLSNKEIGQRLFLSDRTVGAHLYRLFPKLGISSRAALRDALDSLHAEQAHHTAATQQRNHSTRS
jgi:ATP/maltotriose-dependent transcriptional regulator MalT